MKHPSIYCRILTSSYLSGHCRVCIPWVPTISCQAMYAFPWTVLSGAYLHPRSGYPGGSRSSSGKQGGQDFVCWVPYPLSPNRYSDTVILNPMPIKSITSNCKVTFFAKFFFTVTFRFEQIAKDFAKAPCSQLDLRAILLQLFTKLRYITAVQLRDANQLSFNVPMPEVW